MKKPFKILRNTPEEEAAINAGIAADPDTYVATDDEWYAVYPRRKDDLKTTENRKPSTSVSWKSA